ncbi:hypothetical protein EZJ19_06610 [Parasulfuritortus cantonensis]|uniref:DUF2946 domain-containing protein n=1 Tax=Parasulfuritortus cantonensis TaxID=2528202 RepID=A0A4R1BEG8_9PROT|nr:hypothetical protein [Parasulfuritortus cantonensis]TCJ15501.1 hypothetical protein EZJ19_06610 [Parasulfuritortus cantonensis]
MTAYRPSPLSRRATRARPALAVLRHLALALFLVLGQVGIVAHAVGHLAEHHGDHGPGGEPPCAQCLAYAHMGAALPSASPPPPAVVPEARPDPVLPRLAGSRWQPVYLSRAPPTPARSV